MDAYLEIIRQQIAPLNYTEYMDKRRRTFFFEIERYRTHATSLYTFAWAREAEVSNPERFLGFQEMGLRDVLVGIPLPGDCNGNFCGLYVR